MPTPILGKEIIILYNGSPLAYGTSYTLNINKSLVDVTSLASAGYKEQMQDLIDWSVDFDGLACRTVGDASVGYDYLVQTIKGNTPVTIALKINASTNKYESGSGYTNKVTFKGSATGAVTFSGSVSGTGPLTTMTA